MCKQKQFGGMGVINLEDMKTAMLCKWWLKLIDPRYQSLWSSATNRQISRLDPNIWRHKDIVKKGCVFDLSVDFWNEAG